MKNAVTVKELLGIGDCEIDKTEETYDQKDHKVKIIHMHYIGDMPDTCHICGEPFYKHGKRTINFEDTPIGGVRTTFRITVPRVHCMKCGTTFQPYIDGTYLNTQSLGSHMITQRAFNTIAQKAVRNTFQSVAADYNLSANTIKNIFTTFSTQYKDTLSFETPTIMGLDEIKIKKIGIVTVVTDIEHRTLYDMFLGRTKEDLTRYFSKMSDREKVKYICSDMYGPFMTAGKPFFPDATWIIDHFHVVGKANEAIDDVRRTIQDNMSKSMRISTKRGLAYTLKTRAKDLDTEEGQKIALCRKTPGYEPLAIAFDLKEDFFGIYESNNNSMDNARSEYVKWEKTIPPGPLYDKFREISKMVVNHDNEIFNYWSAPYAITNAFTECSNRLIREDNLKGRGYSFDVLRARSLFRGVNLEALLDGRCTIGPQLEEKAPNFLFEAQSDDEDE